MSTLSTLFTDIADAIRAKKGTESEIAASDFPSEIMSIPTGSAPTGTKTVNVTANGTRTEDVSGYANVQINTNVPQGYTPTGHRDYYITTNTGRIDDNVSGIADISIIVNVPTSSSYGRFTYDNSSAYAESFLTYDTHQVKQYYFIDLGINPAGNGHIAIIEQIHNRCVAEWKDNIWTTYNENGNIKDQLSQNGNLAPCVYVARRCAIFVVK